MAKQLPSYLFVNLHILIMKTLQIADLTKEEQQCSQALCQLIQNEIREKGDIPFSHFMELALYAPNLGYYANGRLKIGQAGDFITAPTLSPLFAQTLAQQLKPLLPEAGGVIYEFGAGTGVLAADLLNALESSLHTYYIIEISAQLSEQQRQHIAEYAPEFLDKVIWLTQLPEQLEGILIGNEVLDAMPIERIRHSESNEWQRVYVSQERGEFILKYQETEDENIVQAALQYFPDNTPYTSELHLTQYAFIQTLAQKLTRGAMIWIDYGFDAAQYYHPQRDDGTLIGHHRHHSIHDPFYRIGLTDLTSHVNFSDIADAACTNGFDLIGYTTQANFLLNLGILEQLEQQYPETESIEYIRVAAAVHQLTAQHEMGELFKVIAFGKNISVDWHGFLIGDMCHKL